MPRITDEELVRVQVRLFKVDYDAIMDAARLQGDNPNAASASRLIRSLVRAWRRQRDARLEATAPAPALSVFDITLAEPGADA